MCGGHRRIKKNVIGLRIDKKVGKHCTRVYTPACGRPCNMGRQERERKAAARTCHSRDTFFSFKKRKTGMYFKLITFQNMTGPTPNHLLWYQHTPDLHPGTAKAGRGGCGFSFSPKAHF